MIMILGIPPKHSGDQTFTSELSSSAPSGRSHRVDTGQAWSCMQEVSLACQLDSNDSWSDNPSICQMKGLDH